MVVPAWQYADVHVYEGQWVRGRKTGAGSYLYPNGDVFIGSFIDDRREGLGTLNRVRFPPFHVACTRW